MRELRQQRHLRIAALNGLGGRAENVDVARLVKVLLADDFFQATVRGIRPRSPGAVPAKLRHGRDREPFAAIDFDFR